MDSFSTPSRRSFDLPKPDTGLAEWTSKIKAIQKQVDADEENEQKRLEEEITAARQARLRRSRGGAGDSRADSLDFSRSREHLGISTSANDTSANDTPKSFSETQNDRDTALRKLMDRNSVYNPDKVGGANTTKTDSVSLASYIGGRASGPRLNRHAPQPDAHDPTQFVQPGLSAPHPVFGTGGVAMPGMNSKRESKSPVPFVGSEMAERYRPSSAKSSPVPARHDINRLEEPTKQDINRRSFTATPKSPSPALAQRYTEKFNIPVARDTKPVPVLSKQKSNSSISTPLTPASTTINRENSSTNLSTSPSKSTDYLRASTTPHTWKSSPSTPSYGGEKPVSSFSTTTAAFKPISGISNLSTPGGTSAVTSSTNLTPSKSIQTTATPSPMYRGNSTGPIPTYSLPRKGTSTAKEDTPLRRLMERNHVHNPDKLESENSRKSVAERAQITSLAAFMGGSGKGIRLNKHAPQANAHDPTQFVQPDLSAPHPIFGKGGVAMPGMVTRKSVPDASAGIDSTGIFKPSSVKKATWPPASSPDKVEERPESPQKMTRARTTSAPRLEPQTAFRGSQTTSWTPSRATERSVSPIKDPVTIPMRDRTISTPSAASSRQAIVTPSLARPIQPKSNSSSFSPQIPPAIASPAFNKPAAQKDLTPSLSRLQGRGFVQNMVKATSQLSNTPPSPTQTPPRPASTTGKKSSVLDRWQPNVQPGSPTKSTSMTNVVKPTTSGSSGSSGGLSSQSLKSTTSLPSLSKPVALTPPSPQKDSRARTEDPYPRSRTPGLGSATTMVVIKPSKSFTDLAEMGMKPGYHDESRLSDPDPLSRKTPIYFSRDKTREPKRKFNLQHLSEGPVKKGSEDVISVPQSAPASVPAFSMPSQRQRMLDALAPPIALVQSDLKVDPVKVKSPIERMETSPKTPESVSPTAPAAEIYAPSSPQKERSSQPSSPVKHIRIPSTGNRPTVMEVAQVLNNPPHDEPELQQPSNGLIQEDMALSPVPRPMNPSSQAQAEKRRSNYERYSAVILPSLPEEATPVPSPAGTLKTAPTVLHDVGGLDDIVEDEDQGSNEVEELMDPKDFKLSQVVHIPVVDEPPFQLSNVDVRELLGPRPQLLDESADIQPISVEVLSIVANSATILSKMPEVFYDTEILAIVHRVKSKTSGLASTSVWCWLGKRSSFGDREEKKLYELSKRYGTSAKLVHHLAEPMELARILGGRTAIRQGTRNHWTPENTSMHLVRSLGDMIFIDEQDFNIKNMCSAFSYCFSILGSIYVWHGRGSTARERQGALDYAQTLSMDPVTPIELFEGGDDADEMFWMILGDDDFAKADYWQWRPSCSDKDPLIWRIDRENRAKPVVPVEFISMEPSLQDSVYVINCIWELFVLVGKNARGQRATIRYAVELSKSLSSEIASERPYPPTVHVLVLPSQLPMDLRLGIRDLDEAWVNNGEIPHHMNLMSCSEAITHLDRYSWDLAALKDPDMLPLGVGASALS